MNSRLCLGVFWSDFWSCVCCFFRGSGLQTLVECAARLGASGPAPRRAPRGNLLELALTP